MHHPVGEQIMKEESYRVFIRALDMQVRIGASAAERATPQKLRIALDMQARDVCAGCGDDLAAVVCYSEVAKRVRRLIRDQEPIVLLETLAEKICAEILRDERILRVTLCLEKPEVLEDQGCVGIEITRRRHRAPSAAKEDGTPAA